MIPFLTEVLELAAAGLLLAGAVPLFKKTQIEKLPDALSSNFSIKTMGVFVMPKCTNLGEN
ncbi:MAG: hypothetical protein P8Q26_08855 [Ascidiaceihabitans sp.]|nr:hypothetical protein [Ascidiaceihabitans sp.]